MSSPTSVIRRYTPPTCTLEIAAKDSPLSRWMGQSVLKNLRFKLSFDDPRLTESQWITVRGDRAQLQALSDAVTSYVQHFLSQSSTYLNRSSATVGTAEPATNFITETNPAGIYLQPKGLVSHELHLGTLATENSGSTIRLSAVQLADLATALDEYAADVTALPNLERPRWISTPPAWGTIAAAAIVAIGLVPLMAKVFEPTATQTATTATQAPSSNDQRLAVQPLPSPSPSPLTTLPSSPLPLASLPPNPPAPNNATSSSPTAPQQPQQMPSLKISQQPPVDAPPPELQIPVQDVPVAAIPDQTKTSPSQARSAAPSAPNVATEPVPPTNDVQIAGSNPEVSTLQGQAQPSSATVARSSAVGSIPQVAEAKTFFQGRWQPPKELTEAIEYRLVLSPDGTIQKIVPLGQAADNFLDRTPMPLIGEKFVSPIKSGSSPTIRLLLSPNGTVQTFLESQ